MRDYRGFATSGPAGERPSAAKRNQSAHETVRVRHDPTRPSSGVLPEAREVFELRLAGFKKGEGEYSSVRRAQQNLDRAAAEYLDAVAEVRRAEVQVCGLLADGTEEPAGPESDGKPRAADKDRPPPQLQQLISGAAGRGPDDRAGSRPAGAGD